MAETKKRNKSVRSKYTKFVDDQEKFESLDIWGRIWLSAGFQYHESRERNIKSLDILNVPYHYTLATSALRTKTRPRSADDVHALRRFFSEVLKSHDYDADSFLNGNISSMGESRNGESQYLSNECRQDFLVLMSGFGNGRTRKQCLSHLRGVFHQLDKPESEYNDLLSLSASLVSSLIGVEKFNSRTAIEDAALGGYLD